jgi:hypothetical protein
MNQVSAPIASAMNPNAPPPPKLFAVSLVTGELWQLGGFVPGSELTKSRGTDPSNPVTLGREIEGTEGQQALIIMEMFPNEDGSIEVFASPVRGSAFDLQQTGAIFTLYPLTIQRTLTVARFDVFRQMLAEAQADALDTGDEEELEPEIDPVGSPGTSPATNGGGAPIAGAS